MDKYIDLHTHTTASDGVISPEKLVEQAKELDLAAIAITDHDQVGSVKAGVRAGGEVELEVIAGVELSCYWLENKRKEFHILGYFINDQDEELLAKLDYFRQERIRRAQAILAKLQELGYAGEWEYLVQMAQGAIGQPHIARTILENSKNEEKLLKEFGKIPSIGEFIEKYMIKGRVAHVEKAGFEPKRAVALIHKTGGVAVLAHPCYDVAEGDLMIWQVLKSWGIEGLEAWAPYKTAEETLPKIRYFERMAKEHQMVITGGSDYHGIEGIGAGLGMFEWGLRIKSKMLENLKVLKT